MQVRRPKPAPLVLALIAGEAGAIMLYFIAGIVLQLTVWAHRADVSDFRLLERHGDEVHCLAFSSDAKTLASGGVDQTVRLWGVGPGDVSRPAHGRSAE